MYIRFNVGINSPNRVESEFTDSPTHFWDLRLLLHASPFTCDSARGNGPLHIEN